MTVNYGYGDAAPDSDKYGYEEAIPDSERYQYKGDYDIPLNAPSTLDIDKYGYGEVLPDYERYRYDERVDGHSSCRRSMMRRGQSSREFRRRSSMTPSDEKDRRQRQRQRRSSIGCSGEVVIVNLPGQSKPVRRRSSISFDVEDDIQEIAPVQELTNEPEKLWFQPHEYSQIREKAIFITNIASSGAADQAIAQKKLCTRGLESHIYKEYVEEEQDLAWRSVFIEQYQQQIEGSFDDEAVAKMYEAASMPSRARALRRAQEDHCEAEKHTRKVRNILRRHSLVA